MIRVRIEAESELAARAFALQHDILDNGGKWHPNRVGKGGRIYLQTTFENSAAILNTAGFGKDTK